MQKADLHVHSKYSDHPSEWFLQRLGAAESYTDPDALYLAAIRQGMDFVTVTDHNCMKGALYLKNKHPDHVFTGVESTAYFPEDGCKVHILIFGLSAVQFQEIERRRTDIYQLRKYLLDEDLAYSVAHATYAVNNRLTAEHLEKLVLLFNVFEGRNGARDKTHNQGWTTFLRDLTPETIHRLQAKHRIDPIGETPWVKGFTGGSDDHAALFIGHTCTLAPADTPEGFLQCLRDKMTLAEGRNSNYRAFAFSIYKIAYDFSQSKSHDLTSNLLNQISSALFDRDRPGILGRLRLNLYKRRAESNLNRMVIELLQALRNNSEEQIDAKIEIVYDHVARIADEFLRLVFDSLDVNVRDGNLEELVKTVWFSLPGILLSVPFLSAFKHLHADKQLLRHLRDGLGLPRSPAGKRVLWFTDTLTDLNGVSATLREFGWIAHREGREVCLVTAMLAEESAAAIPPNVINLPMSYHFRLPYYEALRIKIPSILSSLKLLFEYDPDEIFISSPGPVGLLGLLMARLLGAKCWGIYHTDFAAEAMSITRNESVAGLVETYTKWFYSLCHQLQVPTREYVSILERRGYDRSRMVVFPRGIDTAQFAPRNGALPATLHLQNGITLLYAGRISKDKNVGFLADLYERITTAHPQVNLLLVGDGPDLREFQLRFQDRPRVHFTGRVDHASLPALYSLADLFVFPSTTDTFGMAVLEAQACGLPALVSDIGGPQEVILDGITGWAISPSDPTAWEARVLDVIGQIRCAPLEYVERRHRARKRIQEQFTWERFMRTIFDEPVNGGEAATTRPAPEKAPAPLDVQLALP